MGQSYGIPTKDRDLRTLPLLEIRKRVARFLHFAAQRPDLEFLVTAIGCGLAGYKPREIAPFFSRAPANVLLPSAFYEVTI
jgi:hypothetical protein